MKCPICGNVMQGRQDKCSRCGCDIKKARWGRATKICPNCGKKSVDGSSVCSRCGSTLNDTKTGISKKLSAPKEFFNDVKEGVKANDNRIKEEIGKQIVNWGGDSSIGCYYADANGKPIKINILVHERGIQIVSKLYQELLLLNEKQIISLEEIVETYQKDKSVIGRGVAGGVLLGPVGAIVGGMSGIGKKDTNIYILHMKYTGKKSSLIKEAFFVSESSFMPLIKKVSNTMTINNNLDSIQIPENKSKITSNNTQDAPKKDTINASKDKVVLLREYKKLMDEGILTEEEFNNLKKDLLKTM